MHEESGQQDYREDEVHERARNRDKEALPFGLREEFVRGARYRIAHAFPGHLDVSAERNCADAVIRIAVAVPDEARPETHRECFDLDLEEFGDEKMTQFVDDDDDAKNNESNAELGETIDHREAILACTICSPANRRAH